MVKRLKKEEKLRAANCCECGCIPDQKTWQAIIREHGDDYAAVMYMAGQYGISENEIITIEDLKTREELHAVAANYNWDNDDPAALYAMIDHPLCDAGTAVLLFWKGSGYRYLSDRPDTDGNEKKAFFNTLISRFRKGEFNSYTIAFDPFDEMYVPSLAETSEQGYVIPGELFCPYSSMYVETEL